MSIWQERFKDPISYLLMETLDFLLFEDGGFIVLEQTGTDNATWNTRSPKH